MSFLATLKLDEEEYKIMYCSFEFHKEIDPTGRPISIPVGGVLEIKLESNRKTNFYDWMISPTLVKSGTITFFRRDEMSRLKNLEFNDAHCIAYKETFDHLGENPMMIEIKVSARELKINDSTFNNNWPD